jgi:UDP-2-acetamido-3-amino-2,3-dideoxy-glucuronate N-acetyltransferase
MRSDRRDTTPTKRIIKCMIGSTAKIGDFVDLFHCEIGNDTRISSFVFIEGHVKIGERCTVKAFVFIPSGVTIEDDVFIGHGTKFINDRYPRAYRKNFKLEPTLVKSGASIGANSTILCGVTIGQDAMVGAGSVVTKNVRDRAVVVGNPAEEIGEARDLEKI